MAEWEITGRGEIAKLQKRIAELEAECDALRTLVDHGSVDPEVHQKLQDECQHLLKEREEAEARLSDLHDALYEASLSDGDHFAMLAHIVTEWEKDRLEQGQLREHALTDEHGQILRCALCDAMLWHCDEVGYYNGQWQHLYSSHCAEIEQPDSGKGE